MVSPGALALQNLMRSCRFLRCHLTDVTACARMGRASTPESTRCTGETGNFYPWAIGRHAPRGRAGEGEQKGRVGVDNTARKTVNQLVSTMHMKPAKRCKSGL